MSEQGIQRKILDFLNSKKAYTVKVESASRAGVPDILACYKGRFVAIEVKTPTTMTRVSALQKANIDMIHKAKGYAIVACDVEQVKELLLDIDLDLRLINEAI